MTVFTPEIAERARAMKAAGDPSWKIGEALGIKTATVISYFWRNGEGGGTSREKEPPSENEVAEAVMPSRKRRMYHRLHEIDPEILALVKDVLGEGQPITQQAASATYVGPEVNNLWPIESNIPIPPALLP